MTHNRALSGAVGVQEQPMRSTTALVATFVLVGTSIVGVPAALWLMTVNLAAGLALAVALVACWPATMRFIDRREAWGRPKPGNEGTGQLWKLRPPSGGL
jgi:hypothetical protein